MQRQDARGNPVSTLSGAAVDASERALWRLMSFYGAPLDDIDAAAAADPAWPLPALMRAGFLLGLTEPALRAEGLAALAEAEALVERGTPGTGSRRELAHLVALQALAAGDWAGAGAAWGRVLEAHPRDALALQWAHLFDFYRGDAIALRDRVARVLPEWPADDALQPYVLGLHAFGLEENGEYAAAEATGRRALDGPARVPWAIHAVAHVMEMQGRHDEGRGWMAQWRPDWGATGDETSDGANGFAGHLGWHEALFALENLDHAGALAAFDAYLHAEASEITLQRVDAASLLWRMALQGVDVGERWQVLRAGWPLDAGAAAGQSAFNDVHALLMLLGAGERALAAEWAGASIARAAAAPGWNRGVMAEIGAPLMRGLLAFGEGRFDAATALIAPLRPASRLGGSHAQRDVIDQTLLAAGAAGRDPSAARALLAERARLKPGTPLTRWWAGRLGATPDTVTS